MAKASLTENGVVDSPLSRFTVSDTRASCSATQCGMPVISGRGLFHGHNPRSLGSSVLTRLVRRGDGSLGCVDKGEHHGMHGLPAQKIR